MKDLKELLPALEANAIHIWQIDLQANENQIVDAMRFLDAEERERAERFKFQKHQRRFVMAHYALRTILAKYIDCEAEKIVFAKHKHGKPYLPDFPELHFNLSHSEELALCAITLHTPLGVDIEYQKENTDHLNIAKRFFSEREYKELQNLPASLLSQGFYNAWTRKEAFIKALGDGLHFPLDKFSVSLTPDAPVVILDIDNGDARQWELLSFTPTENYTAAVALARKNNQLESFSF